MRQTFYEFCMLHERTNLLKEWDESRNFPLTPDTVSYGSKKKVWWTCENGHSWQSPVASRTAWGHGCPVCAGKTIVTGENDLAHLQPEIAAQWDKRKNGCLKPSDVAVSSNRPAWWRCELGHSYRATVSSRTQRKTGCPYCAGRKVLKGFNDLKTLCPGVAAQ